MNNPFDPPSGPFANPDRHNPAIKVVPEDRWGGSVYQGGYGAPDGPGHGHASPGMDPRHPVSDFLGNTAIRGAGVGPNPPRWP